VKSIRCSGHDGDQSLPLLIKGGFAAAEEIKKALPSIPILLISTRRDAEIVGQSKLAGAQGFISKYDLHSALLKATDALLRGEKLSSKMDTSSE